jgi:outer membrane receptor protein involved in Fe transport
MHNFNLSYTRRLRNPSNTQLSEYIDYGEDDYSIGNSLLASVATNSFEFNWMKYFEKFGSLGITVYHRNSHRDINTLTDVAYSDVFGRYVRYTMPVNVGKSYNTGGEFNVTYRPKGFLNLRFYANIYDSYINYSDSKDANKNSIRHKFTYSFRINLWTKVWNVLEIHASANYRSASQSLFSETKPNYSINAGLRATFWKKRISVYLNVQDIFNWNKSSNITTNPYYESWSSNKTNSRYISAGVTFRFGKLEMEKNVQGVGSEE